MEGGSVCIFLLIEYSLISVADRVFGGYDSTRCRSSVSGSERDESQRMGIQDGGTIPRDCNFFSLMPSFFSTDCFLLLV